MTVGLLATRLTVRHFLAFRGSLRKNGSLIQLAQSCAGKNFRGHSHQIVKDRYKIPGRISAQRQCLPGMSILGLFGWCQHAWSEFSSLGSSHAFPSRPNGRKTRHFVCFIVVSRQAHRCRSRRCQLLSFGGPTLSKGAQPAFATGFPPPVGGRLLLRHAAYQGSAGRRRKVSSWPAAPPQAKNPNSLQYPANRRSKLRPPACLPIRLQTIFLAPLCAVRCGDFRECNPSDGLTSFSAGDENKDAIHPPPTSSNKPASRSCQPRDTPT